ncbi:diacylglycerol kinase family protein [Chryseolinea lacunae]|uniref:Diacylglycerol kinase family protein n=1 Tax=Chryseolinea lacunae TaxID=2801331 RepID=A0ABS1KPK7_9BACT|nr:diacylglycerol kinase family protein [Chryseolinea lacunae]MBL0741356.1 diacylglycerol kinase family protein [Chryseolinea lacunae]
MRRLLKSFVYAFHGIWSGISGERNLKVQIGVALLVVGAGFYVQITPEEWCIVCLCIGVVIGLELMNSAIEELVNMITLERNPQAGKIKDIAAGAVLVVSCMAVVVGIIIFRKYLL